MYEYKVETYKVKEAEEKMNTLARAGWRVIAVTANLDSLTRLLVVTFERNVKQV